MESVSWLSSKERQLHPDTEDTASISVTSLGRDDMSVTSLGRDDSTASIATITLDEEADGTTPVQEWDICR